jgi:hypothetical protein
MPPPEVHGNRINKAIANLKVQYSNAAGIQQILAAEVEEIAELETAIIDVWVKYTIEYGEGYALDLIGAILDAPRGGLTDTNYKALLRAQILTLRSTGKVEELYTILRTIEDREYRIYPKVNMTLIVEAREAWGAVSVDTVIDILNRAREAGWDLIFVYFENYAPLRFASQDATPEYSATEGLANAAETEGGRFARDRR